MKLWRIVMLPVLALTLINTTYAQVPNLQGDWESIASETNGPIFATRAFHFEDDRWKVAFHAFADADRKVPLFSLDVGGMFVIGDLSATVTDAYEGVFPARYRKITADSDAGVNFFASMGCTLHKGEVKNLLSQGCGFIPGLMQAMGEYDLVSIKNGELFFGDRSGDLTKARPVKLTAFALRKVLN